MAALWCVFFFLRLPAFGGHCKPKLAKGVHRGKTRERGIVLLTRMQVPVPAAEPNARRA